VPEGQAGAALQVKMPVPATLDIVLPLGQAGVGGVTAHVPVEAWKLPDEHVGETVQMYVVPGCVSVVVPGQTGEGGVTVHRPVPELKVPEEHVGAALPTHRVAEPLPVRVKPVSQVGFFVTPVVLASVADVEYARLLLSATVPVPLDAVSYVPL